MPIGASAYGRAKQRHNTIANLIATNPIPAVGEILVGVTGTTIIVKIGDGVTAWNALPEIYPHPEGGGAGGGPVGFGQAYPTAMTMSTVSGGGSAVPTSWSGGGGLIVPGSFGFGFTDPGWYQVSVMIWAGFTGALPNFLRATLQTYDVAEAFGDFVVVPAPAGGTASLGTTTSRSLPGVVATMTSPVFYQDDSGVTGTNACQIRLGWDNDAAALESANGGSPASAVHADITRVA